jgi:uncharacterized protein (TIGR03086 family)
VNSDQHLRAAVALVVSAVQRTPVERYDDPTPCTEFSVADLINHIVLGLEVARRHGVREPLDLSWTADQPAPALQGLPREKWAAVCAEAGDATIAAWASPEAWTGDAPMGDVRVPAPLLGTLMTGEFAVHAWDLATALGHSLEIEEDLAAVTIEAMTAIATMGREKGWVGPEVAAPAEASTFERALAIAGRRPAGVG